MSESSPLDSLISAASELVSELSSAVPRLLERSRDQLAVVVALAEKLPCGDLLGGGSTESTESADHKAPSPVAPISSARSAKRAPATKTAAKKAPAKKAPAKKTTAKKTVAKKAPAKKAPAKKKVTQPVAAVASSASDGLGLSSYDSLAASQVIPRLDGLSPAELEAVRLHETAGRNRRTILNRVAQLQRG